MAPSAMHSPEPLAPPPLGRAPRTRVRGGGVERSAEDDRLEPGTAAGEYVIDRHLADGGTASVYDATHPLIGKRAAVKVLNWMFARNEAAIDRFVHEARAVNQIRHPNIVDIFAFGKLSDGRHYLAMERLEGETLFDRMQRGALSLTETVDVLGQICDALDAAHAHHIAHLDLKPENIFLVPMRGGKTLVKLLDFGIARLFNDEERELAGEFIGTPDYASPEQARGLNTVNHTSDVYSLGVLAYELLVGERPFAACSPTGMLWKHLSEVPRTPSSLNPSISPQVEQLLLAMLAKVPAERPTMTDVRQALVAVYPAVATLVSHSIAVARPLPPALVPDADRGQLVIPRRRAARWAMALTCAVLTFGGMAVSAYRTSAAQLPMREPLVEAAAPRAAASVPSVVMPIVVPIAETHARAHKSSHRAKQLVARANTARAPGDDYVLDYAGQRR